MRQTIFNSRGGWLAIGLIAGVVISYAWPHNPARAVTNSRADKFEMFTVPVALGGLGVADGVFVLDHLTGMLQGAIINRQSAAFTTRYFRNLAADFNVDPDADAQYAVVGAQGQLNDRPGASSVPLAQGLIYVGEINSGRVNCYAFRWRESVQPLPPMQLVPIASFPWREAALAE